ncbi:MAG: hypothetical protein K2X03_02625 [Bryobacteraceae bacterium]|nr:hypothetical protein [Bryobacteraceae bacterium]
MLRFLTPTQPWVERVGRKMSVPAEWPLMLIEIFHLNNDRLAMTCALGVPQMSARAFRAQGTYLYEFEELPASVVAILDAHFDQVEKEILEKVDSRADEIKPQVILVKR